MKGKGEKGERETIIRFSEADAVADIWTASEPIYRRLIKLGYVPVEDAERHARFQMPKTDVKLPRPKRKLSPERLQSLQNRFRTQNAPKNRGTAADNSKTAKEAL